MFNATYWNLHQGASLKKQKQKKTFQHRSWLCTHSQAEIKKHSASKLAKDAEQQQQQTTKKQQSLEEVLSEVKLKFFSYFLKKIKRAIFPI